MNKIKRKVIVAGGGVAGMVAADALSAAGHHVVLYERGRLASSDACSWWAGGMLAPFCELETAEPLVAELGASAADYWQTRTRVNFTGTLVVAARRDMAELARFGRKTCHFKRIDGSEISRLEADLAGRFTSALWFKDEANLDPRRALVDLAGHLRKSGVELIEQTAAPDVYPDSEILVDCRGFAARDRLDQLRGVKGEMLIVRTKEINLNRTVRFLHPRWPVYIVPRADGEFMIGATMFESEDRQRITARSMVELLNAAYAVHPAFADAEILEAGTDVRPAFEDNLPQVLGSDGRYSINGLYRHGFLLAPALAQQLVTKIEHECGVQRV